MDKQNVVNTHNGILFSHKKESSSDTAYNMGEPLKHYAMWDKPATKWQISYDPTYEKYLD